MSKTDDYRAALRGLRSPDEWEDYLMAHSGLPGARANLELGQAAAQEGSLPLFDRLLEWDAERAPENTPATFLAFCGAVGLGRLAADGDTSQLTRLRRLASDPRWRVREAVTTGLQLYGHVDMPALIAEMRAWATGGHFEQRAAIAALCEPPLLKKERTAAEVLDVLDGVTRSLAETPAAARKTDGFKVLRQALGYCWSVAVAACPAEGKPLMEQWLGRLGRTDPDVRWVMAENLKKARLVRMDAAWVARLRP